MLFRIVGLPRGRRRGILRMLNNRYTASFVCANYIHYIAWRGLFMDYLLHSNYRQTVEGKSCSNRRPNKNFSGRIDGSLGGRNQGSKQ